MQFFQSKGFWMAKGPGCLNDGEMTYDNSSRIEPKRAHPWFVDPTEPELFPNKKQAIDASNSKSISGISNINVSPWDNTLSFQSVPSQFGDRLFGSEPARAINFGARNILSVNTGHLNMGRKVFEDQFGHDPSVGLSISHTMEDPASCLSYGGIRKVKINQVKDSDNGISVSMGHAYNGGDNNIMSIGDAYDKRDDHTISMGHAYDKRDGNAISIGHTYDKRDDNPISMGHTYDKRDDNPISMGHTYDKRDENTISIDHTYNKGDENTISMSHAYNKGDDNTISMGHAYNKEDQNTMSMTHAYKGDENTMKMGHIYNKADDGTITMGHIFNKGDNNIISMGHPYNKGDSTTISFTGFHEETDTNPSGRLISSSYDLLMSQSSVQTSETETVNEKELVDTSVNVFVNNAQNTSGVTETVTKNKMEIKMSKKVAPNNFPSNVKSLLSTGMLDGVHVKYISWSREKELRGVIKGSGYLCSCQSCNFSKVLNAYEFERHAGCKTKHPNNHIFFDNGKTIYGIVQELRSTPQNLLFDAIQTVTGSPINQKSFRIWKASFEAATRELQRIFGKDEAQQSQSEVF